LRVVIVLLSELLYDTYHQTKKICKVNPCSSVISWLVCSCDSRKEKERAQLTADSLRTELQANHKLTEAMVEIGTLLDSIDANRKVLRVRMIEGTNYETFAGRMRDLNQYVRVAEQKLHP